MPITVACTQCGKQLNVKDEYLGKKLKCPQCSATFIAQAPRTPIREKIPRVHVSKSVIIFVAIAIALPTIFGIYHYGPGKVSDDWNKNLPDHEDRVKDVVTRGLQAYLSMSGEFDPSVAHHPPVALDVTFVFGPMYFSMPDKVGFAGSSTQGAFSGNFHPKTGEVEAEVEVGGLSFPGTGAIKRGNKTFALTGRQIGDKLTVEIDGKPADIVWPKHVD